MGMLSFWAFLGYDSLLILFIFSYGILALSGLHVSDRYLLYGDSDYSSDESSFGGTVWKI